MSNRVTMRGESAFAALERTEVSGQSLRGIAGMKIEGQCPTGHDRQGHPVRRATLSQNRPERAADEVIQQKEK
jgi:hypothetical protein